MSTRLGNVKPVHRLAGGVGAPWGARIDVPKGVTLSTRQEILRASVGYPVPWCWQVWLDGAAPGAFAGSLDVTVEPGIGRGGVTLGQPFQIQPGLGTYITGGTGLSTPATELVVHVKCDHAAVLAYAICSAACPASNWLPKGIGNGVQW